MDLFDLVSAEAIAAYYKEAASNAEPYLGDGLFPVDRRPGLDLSWIKGRKGLPVALKPSTFDAKARIRDRIGFTKIETEMPFFRESMKIKEKDRQELLKLESAKEGFYKTLVKEIFKDRANLIAGAKVQAERMRMQLLIGGKIHISADGVDYTYDFDQSGEYASKNTLELLGNNRWKDHENSKPVQDLQEAKRRARKRCGTTPKRAVVSSDTWTDLLLNKSIRMDMDTLRGENIILTDSMLEQYLLTKLKLKFVIYDKQFIDEHGQEQSFFPDGYVSLLPAHPLGTTWYGTTPEEADLMSGSEVSVEIVETGVAVTTIKQPHPVNVDTIVSQIVLPSFECMDDTFLLKVA